MREEFMAILYCPVCATNQDVGETGWVEIECNNCGTEFKVLVSEEVVAEHAMFG